MMDSSSISSYSNDDFGPMNMMMGESVPVTPDRRDKTDTAINKTSLAVESADSSPVGVNEYYQKEGSGSGEAGEVVRGGKEEEYDEDDDGELFEDSVEFDDDGEVIEVVKRGGERGDDESSATEDSYETYDWRPPHQDNELLIANMWSAEINSLINVCSSFETITCLRRVAALLEEIDRRDRLKFCKSDFEAAVETLRMEGFNWWQDLSSEVTSIMATYFDESPFRMLPEIIIAEIFMYLEWTEMAPIMQVCSDLHNVGLCDELWGVFYQRKFLQYNPSSYPSRIERSLTCMQVLFRRRLEHPIVGDRIEVSWKGKFRLEAQEVYQGVAWWVADIVDVHHEQGRYKIRYLGWAENWDDWVPRSRLRWAVEPNHVDRLYVGDRVELWCVGSNVPGAWLETKIKKVKNRNEYALENQVQSANGKKDYVRRERLRLVKRGAQHTQCSAQNAIKEISASVIPVPAVVPTEPPASPRKTISFPGLATVSRILSSPFRGRDSLDNDNIPVMQSTNITASNLDIRNVRSMAVLEQENEVLVTTIGAFQMVTHDPSRLIEAKRLVISATDELRMAQLKAARAQERIQAQKAQMQEELRQRAASFDSTSPMSPRERELLQELSQLRRINNNNINNDNNSVGSRSNSVSSRSNSITERPAHLESVGRARSGIPLPLAKGNESPLESRMIQRHRSMLEDRDRLSLSISMTRPDGNVNSLLTLDGGLSTSSIDSNSLAGLSQREREQLEHTLRNPARRVTHAGHRTRSFAEIESLGHGEGTVGDDVLSSVTQAASPPRRSFSLLSPMTRGPSGPSHGPVAARSQFEKGRTSSIMDAVGRGLRRLSIRRSTREVVPFIQPNHSPHPHRASNAPRAASRESCAIM